MARTTGQSIFQHTLRAGRGSKRDLAPDLALCEDDLSQQDAFHISEEGTRRTMLWGTNFRFTQRAVAQRDYRPTAPRPERPLASGAVADSNKAVTCRSDRIHSERPLPQPVNTCFRPVADIDAVAA